MTPAQYFPHDYHARHHPQLLALRRRHGLAGLGAFWCLVEYLYEQGGRVPLDHLPELAYDLHAEGELLTSLVHDFGLFEVDAAGLLRSPAVDERLTVRQEKREKAQKSAANRWSGAAAMPTQSERSANAVPTQSERSATAMLIKEKEKGKEKRKEKENNIPPLNTTQAAAAAPESEADLPTTEKKEGTRAPAAFAPTGLDAALLQRDDVAAAWQAFLAHRRKIKAPVTPYALQLILGKLRQLRGTDGAGWAELLNASVERGWRSVFEIDPQLKNRTHDHRPPTTKPTLAERYNDAARDLLAGL